MNKKIFLAGLLCLASVASVVGTVGNAHKVEAAYNFQGHIYFERPSDWTQSKVLLMIGHSGWSAGYEMKNVPNTDLYYYAYTSESWGGATEFAFFDVSSVWGGEGSSISHRSAYANHASRIIKEAEYKAEFKDTHYLFTNTANSNHHFDNYTGINKSVTVSSENGGTVEASGYKLTSSTNTALSKGTAISVAMYTDVTLTATASEGYEFEGWYDGATRISTNLTHTVNNVTEAKTYTAKFTKIAVKEVNTLFAKYYNKGSYTKDSVLNTSKIADNEVAKYFHASADTKYRKTVYTPTGLTMTTSTDGVKYENESKYENGDGNVVHTGFNGNWTVNKPSVEDWFVTLKDFVDASTTGWEKTGTVYSHVLEAATATGEDDLTRMAREFVAPMWLAPNAVNYTYASFTKLTVQEVDNTLVMKLYVDPTDSGILVEGSENVFSQVTISFIR